MWSYGSLKPNKSKLFVLAETNRVVLATLFVIDVISLFSYAYKEKSKLAYVNPGVRLKSSLPCRSERSEE
jgi:hypothetical protein